MIVADNLTKRYGAKTAVDGVSFTVAPGRVTGFLGPNGAGKSTTMRMIVGSIAPPPAGHGSPGREYRHLRSPLTEVGVLLDAKAVHTGRSARNHLRALAATHGIGRNGSTRSSSSRHRRGRGEARARFSLGMGQRSRHRGGAARRPAHADPRRARERPRPRGRALGATVRAPPGRRGPHGPAVEPPDERDGADRRPRHRPGVAASSPTRPSPTSSGPGRPRPSSCARPASTTSSPRCRPRMPRSRRSSGCGPDHRGPLADGRRHRRRARHPLYELSPRVGSLEDAYLGPDRRLGRVQDQEIA